MTPQDPLSMFAQFYNFITTGHGTMAVGVALTLVVWAIRAGLGAKWAFWKTPLGGYLLGFSLPAITYLGTALEAGQSISLALIGNVLGAGWVAAGGWEHLRDLLGKISGGTAAVAAASNQPPNSSSSASPPGSARVGWFTLALVIVFLSTSCGTSTGTAVKAGGVAGAACAVKDVLQYAGEVEAALATESFKQALADVAKKENLTQEALTCLVQTVLGVMTARQGGGAATGQEEPMVAHARAYLDSVKK